jgi:hypothetical protein
LERSQWAGVSPGSWLCSKTPTFMLLSFSTVHVEKTQHTQARVRQAATLHLTRRLCLKHALWIKRCPRWSNARERNIVLRGECCTQLFSPSGQKCAKLCTVQKYRDFCPVNKR